MKKKILIITSVPEALKGLDTDGELKIIEDQCESSQNEDFECISIPAATMEEIAIAILRETPEVVHFCCHFSDKDVILRDKNGKKDFRSYKDIFALISSFSDIIECLVLNGCDSGGIAKSLEGSCKNVIGVYGVIYDKEAKLFSKTFYEGIFSNLTYEESYQKARKICSREEIHYEIYKSTNISLIPMDEEFQSSRENKIELIYAYKKTKQELGLPISNVADDFLQDLQNSGTAMANAICIKTMGKISTIGILGTLKLGVAGIAFGLGTVALGFGVSKIYDIHKNKKNDRKILTELNGIATELRKDLPDLRQKYENQNRKIKDIKNQHQQITTDDIGDFLRLLRENFEIRQLLEEIDSVLPA